MHHLCTGPVHVSSLHAYMWRKNLLAWTATSFASLCAHPEQRPLLHHIPQLFPRSFTGLPSHALALHVGTFAAPLLATNAVQLSFCHLQAGGHAIISAVGRMVQRDVLPSLCRLSLGAVL